MRIHNQFLAIAVVALGSAILAQSPMDRPNTAQPPVRPTDPPRPPAQPQPQPPATQATPPNIAQQPQVMNAPATDSSAPGPVLSSAPRMIGDFPSYYGTSTVTINSSLVQIIPTTIIGPNGTPQVVFDTRRIGNLTETFDFRTLALSRGAFKIAENESPQPQDRFYVTYNYFHDVPALISGGTGYLTPVNSSTQYPLRTTLAGTLTGQGPLNTLTDPNASATDVHRETVGFEKTFFDGRASVGLRVPVSQTSQAAGVPTANPASMSNFSSFPTAIGYSSVDPGFDGGRVGDLSTVLKYAFINDVVSGNTVSTGMVITAPTGGGIPLSDGSRMYSTLLQPFVGFLRTFDRFFTHGFTAIAVPTDNRDITIWFNDIGVGYYAYQAAGDQFLRSIIPTLETHISTPLGDGRDGVSALDVVVLTGGAHFGLGRHTVLTLGAGTPVTGPRPYTVEAMAQLNWVY